MRSKVDVANRAMQHIGSARISSFSDTSRQASEVSAMYDVLRRAELRTASWRFATRRIALRPVSTGSPVSVTFPAWASGTTYAAGFVVTGSDGLLYQALVGSNTGNDPTIDLGTNWQFYVGPITATPYSASVSYYGGELVTSGGVVYLSLQNANLNNAPPASQWVTLTAATTAAYVFLDATGYGKSSTDPVKVIYQLPNGFLRIAPQDPKAAAAVVAATSGGLRYLDWEFEGNYLMTSTATLILLRCVVDVTPAWMFDPLFSEALSARLAIELNETITQDAQKYQILAGKWQAYRRMARVSNAIEVANTEDDEDEYQPLFQYVGPKLAQQPAQR